MTNDVKLQDTAVIAEKMWVYKYISSPVGQLKLIASDQGLAGVLWENDDPPYRIKIRSYIEDNTHLFLLETERQLKAYFTGQLQAFDLKLDFVGTPFQKQVWQALLTIPFGQTRTYKQIAQQIANPKAVRAVGAANRKNPISIIAPCHRVIGTSGHLVGFAGGLEVKAWLLNLEASSLNAKIND